MKKIIVACLALFLVVSCSSTDSPSASQDVLVKRTVNTDEKGFVETLNFSYNGNKIVKIESDQGFKVQFTYSGDLITQARYTEGTTEFQSENYTYNSQGQMVTYVLLSPLQDYGAKEVYTYNADGTIEYTRTLGDLVSQTESPTTGKLFFTNGEISKAETYGFGAVNVVNYTYDNKNYPFKNTTGISKISFAGQAISGFNHNILTEDHPNFPDANVTSSYQYNSNNYPISATETSSFGTDNTLFYYE